VTLRRRSANADVPAQFHEEVSHPVRVEPTKSLVRGFAPVFLTSDRINHDKAQRDA
jgi:hypothetical protein